MISTNGKILGFFVNANVIDESEERSIASIIIHQKCDTASYKIHSSNTTQKQCNQYCKPTKNIDCAAFYLFINFDLLKGKF